MFLSSGYSKKGKATEILLEAIIPVKKDGRDININSFGMYRLKEISRMLDEGLSKDEIVRRLER